jgi:hypothetical protein
VDKYILADGISLYEISRKKKEYGTVKIVTGGGDYPDQNLQRKN